MTIARRSVMWPLLMIVLGALWLLIVAGILPEAVKDVLLRAWPALAVLLGFDVLFGRRQVRLGRWAADTSFIGLVLTAVMVLAMVWFAYQEQAEVVRSDQVQTFSKLMPESVQRVILRVEVERTSVNVRPATEFERELALDFSGSAETELTVTWDLAEDVGTLVVGEAYRNTIPKLEDLGRGTLEITLPVGVILEVFDLTVASGDVTLELAPISAEDFTLEVARGDVVLALPTADVLAGDLTVKDGSVEVRVPAGRTLNIKARGSAPDFQFDRDRYDLLVGGELKARSAESFQYSLDVAMKGGAPLIITDLP